MANSTRSGAGSFRSDVCCVLVGSENLLEQRAELNLAPCAACLHVHQHLLQVAHAGGKGLHLSQSLVNKLQSFAHLFERFAQTPLERCVEFFVNSCAHLFQLPLVSFLQFGELVFDRRTHVVERIGKLRACALRMDARLVSVSSKLIPQRMFDSLQPSNKVCKLGRKLRGNGCSETSHKHKHQHPQQEDDQNPEGDEKGFVHDAGISNLPYKKHKPTTRVAGRGDHVPIARSRLVIAVARALAAEGGRG